MPLHAPRASLPAFLALGGFLFWVDASNVSAQADTRSTIVVPADVIDTLTDGWTRQSGHPPDAAQYSALIDGWVHEEVSVRQARAMGLDRGDLVIRRRLLQKMEFLLDELEPGTPATEAELEAWYAAHLDDFRLPERRSLVHVYVSRDRHGDQTHAVAQSLLTTLRTGDVPPHDAHQYGDPSLRPTQWAQRPRAHYARDFGPQFAESVFDAPAGSWTGPHTSSFGTHLVYVTETLPGRVPAMEDVRAEVSQAVTAAARTAKRAQVLSEWTAAYTVEVGRP